MEENENISGLTSLPTKIVTLLNNEIGTMKNNDDLETRYIQAEIIESLISSLDILAGHDQLESKIKQWRL